MSCLISQVAQHRLGTALPEVELALKAGNGQVLAWPSKASAVKVSVELIDKEKETRLQRKVRFLECCLLVFSSKRVGRPGNSEFDRRTKAVRDQRKEHFSCCIISRGILEPRYQHELGPLPLNRPCSSKVRSKKS